MNREVQQRFQWVRLYEEMGNASQFRRGRDLLTHKPFTTFWVERISGNFCDPTHAQSRVDLECHRRGYSLYGEMRIASDDSATRPRAPLEANTLPARLRPWIAFNQRPAQQQPPTGIAPMGIDKLIEKSPF